MNSTNGSMDSIAEDSTTMNNNNSNNNNNNNTNSTINDNSHHNNSYVSYDHDHDSHDNTSLGEIDYDGGGSSSSVVTSTTTGNNGGSNMNMSNHMSNDSMNMSTPFFADMTLDIAVAHDIAETPEAVNRKIYDANHPISTSLPDFPHFPTIPELRVQQQKQQQQQQQQQQHNTPLSQRIEELEPSFTDNNNISVKSQQQIQPPNNDNDNNNNHNHNREGVYDNNDSFDDDNHVMACVTSSSSNNNNNTHTTGGRFRPFGNNSNGGSNWRSRLRRRQWPKDSKWSIAFWTVVPIGLFVPLILYGGGSNYNNNNNSNNNSNNSWLAASASPRSATLHTLIWGLIVAAIILPRLLYRTSGGVGVGDDARHFASQLLLASAPVSACVYLALLGATYFLLPSATWPYGLIPLWYLARDLYLFRRWKMTSTTPGGRQAFFQALACAALDILSRSLRRKALYRTVIMVIIGQFVVIAVWRLSLLAALRSGSVFWTMMAFIGGKWATGTVARLLTLTACGGVSNWFAEQSALLEGIQQMEGHQQQNENQYVGTDTSNDNDNDTEEMIEFSDLPIQSESHNNSSSNSNSNSNSGTQSNGGNRRSLQMDDNNTMPEAYRIADASQYKSTVGTGMDGDYASDDDESFHDEDSNDDEENYGDNGRRTSHLSSYSQQRRRRRERERHERRERGNNSRSTVRQFMVVGLTVSFGSVAKCGLLGGLAQFIWSQIRKIDHARATIGGMRGMDVNGGGGESEDGGVFRRLMRRLNAMARDFVRTHSDMAMSYVADYQMSYTQAAQEVAILVDESGVEPIIHDDISTHMSACVGGSVSGIIILFTGAILVHQRNQNNPSVPDSSVALDMVLAFFFCYTLIFTVMEPLRASIKAVYVCFAQHPEALSSAFPLIFHRLTRMSQSNLH